MVTSMDIRVFPENSSCGPVVSVAIHGASIGILPLNSALFCVGEDDHNRLWIGRRCLDPALWELQKIGADLKIRTDSSSPGLAQ